MQETPPQTIQKTTIVPLHYCGFGLPEGSTYPITENVSIKSFEGILKTENFKLWREYVSDREREALASIRLALFNNFDSNSYIGHEEKESQDLLHKVFVCLRLIKPTRNNFSAIQVRWIGQDQIDVFSFTHPRDQLLNIPHSEVLNVIRPEDLKLLSQIIGPFLKVQDKGPSHIRRAIRWYEEGYTDIQDAVLQIIVWVMGILNAVSEGEAPRPREEILKQIDKRVGFDSNIYEDSWLEDHEYKTKLTVGEAVTDLFKLYDRFICGTWIPKEWEKRPNRRLENGEEVPYADSMRDVASYILRKTILRQIEIG
jgi:hypothetical protein